MSLRNRTDNMDRVGRPPIHKPVRCVITTVTWQNSSKRHKKNEVVAESPQVGLLECHGPDEKKNYLARIVFVERIFKMLWNHLYNLWTRVLQATLRNRPGLILIRPGPLLIRPEFLRSSVTVKRTRNPNSISPKQKKIPTFCTYNFSPLSSLSPHGISPQALGAEHSEIKQNRHNDLPCDFLEHSLRAFRSKQGRWFRIFAALKNFLSIKKQFVVMQFAFQARSGTPYTKILFNKRSIERENIFHFAYKL